MLLLLRLLFAQALESALVIASSRGTPRRASVLHHSNRMTNVMEGNKENKAEAGPGIVG
jgi:hypothetical protein